MGLTKSVDIMKVAGKKIELTKEQKAAQKAQDKIILDGYSLKIDQIQIEIARLERALSLNLPNRETRDNLNTFKTELAQLKKYKKVLEGRNK